MIRIFFFSNQMINYVRFESEAKKKSMILDSMRQQNWTKKKTKIAKKEHLRLKF